MLQVLNSYLRSLGFFVFLYFYESAYGVGSQKNELLFMYGRTSGYIISDWLHCVCQNLIS